ncbi:MAG: ABC transporter substrate-binding protein [Oscillospiraceae bacterium]|nr:ABC transporter substrate-binding protein [Oscillospiraceae bacterium]
MKVKKILALTLALVMLSGVLAACQTGTSAPKDLTIKTNTPRDTLVVGDPGEMNGDFIGGFGNNSYDRDIKILLHGYVGTYHIDTADQIILNEQVVKNVETSVDGAGNKTYTFTLHTDLKWSDGTKMTAKDFVGSGLMEASPQWLEAGASGILGDGLLGYSEYYGGETDVFKGFKLLADDKFSVTIDAEELPYFYETGFVMVDPIPMHSYFPGIDIISDDNGAKFSADISADCVRISETERFAPTVTAGPFKFVNFENQICTLERNDNFKGDPVSKKKPYFKYIIRQTVPEETDIDMLMAGDIDVLATTIDGQKIDQTKASDNLNYHNYLRNGGGALNMVCDWGPTADVNVRWAIAHLIDRNTVVDQFLKGYGGLIDGEYGFAQWAYIANKDKLDSQIIPIAMNIDTANDYLDKSEWKYESDGSTPFDRSKANSNGTYMRHNSKGEKLAIRQAGGSAAVAEPCNLEFQKNAPMAGMDYSVDFVDFNLLLDHYYYAYELSDDERIYSTFSMGWGFGQPDDKYWGSYHSDHYGTWVNPNGIKDSKMDDLIMRMRRLDASQTAEYAEIWLEYILYAQSLMPVLPLYSNNYHDLFNNVIHGWNTTPFAGWSQIICDIEKYR